MITPELVSYIKRQLENNISKDLIVSKLIGAGWRMEDVLEGFSNAGSYYEPKETIGIPLVEKEEPKIIEIPKLEIKNDGVGARVEPVKIELPKTEVQKVWTPISTPVKKVNIPVVEVEKPVYRESYDKVKEETKIEVQNIEIEGRKEGQVISPVSRVAVNLVKNNLDIPQKPKENSVKDLSQIAMLASYQSDVLSLNKKKEEVVKKKTKISIKWLILAIIVLSLIVLAWAFMSGRINIKKMNTPLVKENSKVLLLKNSEVLFSLKSYKTETNIEISSPTFINLLSGEIVDEYISSMEKDSFSINTLGVINKLGGEPLSDNFMTVKSSLFPDYVNIDIKSNGSDLFVSIPDLSKAIDRFVPDPAVVKINREQFSLIPSLFSKKEEERLSRVNLYNIIYSGISSYINNENLTAYNEIVSNVNVTEKGVESIKGIDTYHYSVNIDSQLSKNLLSKVADDFVLNLSTEDNEKLGEMITASNVSSFDVWIGKADDNIYQYSVVIDTPVSTILDPGDKSVGDSKVSISWKTTYYDFDVPNNLFMPSQFTEVNDFANNMKKIQLKNGVSDLKEFADNLFDKEKSYGVKSNSNGSCMSPISGSLFSSVGHNTDVSKEVGDIVTLINEILTKTNGTGSCYSTLKDWSFTIPITDSYDVKDFPEGGYKSFFCADSTGAKENLTALPKGSTCLPKVAIPKQVKP